MAELSITVPLHLDTSEVAAVEERIKTAQEGATAALMRLRGLDQLLKAADVRLQDLQTRQKTVSREIEIMDEVIAHQRRQLAEVPARTLSAQCPQCTRTVGFSVEAVTQGLLVYCCVCDTYYRVGLHLEKGRPHA